MINIANVLREAGSRFQASGPAGSMIRPCILMCICIGGQCFRLSNRLILS